MSKKRTSLEGSMKSYVRQVFVGDHSALVHFKKFNPTQAKLCEHVTFETVHLLDGSEVLLNILVELQQP